MYVYAVVFNWYLIRMSFRSGVLGVGVVSLYVHDARSQEPETHCIFRFYNKYIKKIIIFVGFTLNTGTHSFSLVFN